MIRLPAGDRLLSKKASGCRIADVLPKKKWFYVKIDSSNGRGWVIFKDRKICVAAHFDDGFEEYNGSQALGKIALAFRDCHYEIAILGERVAKLFVSMHPEVVVNGEEDVEAAFEEARYFDAVDAAVGRVGLEMFTEEWEEEKIGVEAGVETGVEGIGEVKEEEEGVSTGLLREGDSNGDEQVSELDSGVSASCTNLRSKLGEGKASAGQGEKQRTEKKWVVSFEEFIRDFEGSAFTGICRGKEGSFEAEVYLKEGKIIAAVVRDEDIELKGEAALFYLDHPVEAEAVWCEYDPPEDTLCSEDERSVDALYAELDRTLRR